MTTTRRRMPKAAGTALKAAAAVASLAMLTGCQLIFPGSGGGADADRTADAEVIGDVPAELMSYYTQDVRWEDCENGFECATITVPMDYENPAGESIDIAAIRSEASGNPLGTVLINPGGPGASGYTTVRDSVNMVTSDRLRDNYDILGFDTRGVGRSSAVKCLTDDERDESRSTFHDLDTAEGRESAAQSAGEFAAKCAANTGELLGHVDTESSARDMDILRAVVGDPKLNYLGFSYGSMLGATYAELFPERSGRLVLDGAMDPSLSNEEITLGQAAGFERAIRAYAQDCLSRPNCPMDGSVDDAVAQIGELIDSVEASPMTASDGRLVPVATFVNGFILPLYNDMNWPTLTQALTGAFNGDPTDMLRLADIGAERNPDGSYEGNTAAAFTAFNCMDYSMTSDPAAMQAEADRLEAASPTIGRYLAYGGVTCQDWAYEPVREPHPIHAAGADPIVVIGTTGDPATPYEWAEALSSQLDSAVMVTWEGQGHTAYGRAGECIEDAVDDYFIDGTVPEDGTRC
jgi:pimeloyl-ACP methyl ester carboxylesterase